MAQKKWLAALLLSSVAVLALTGCYVDEHHHRHFRDHHPPPPPIYQRR